MQEKETEGLEVISIREKGRGVVTTRDFKKGEPLCEYAGELISDEEATIREANYNKKNISMSYLYFFTYKGKKYW